MAWCSFAWCECQDPRHFVLSVLLLFVLPNSLITAAVDRRPLQGSLVLDLEISEYGRPRFLPSFLLIFFTSL